MKNNKTLLLVLIIAFLFIVTIAIVVIVALPNKNSNTPINIISNTDAPVENKEETNTNDIKDTFVKEEITAKVQKGEIAKERSIYVDEENKTAVIPEGYGVVKDATTIKNGLVISDREDDDMNNTKDGNQFVWVPIEVPILDVSKYTTDNQINSALQKQANEGKYPMAIRLSDGNYEGVLYDFAEIRENTVISITPATYGTGSTRKEPSNVTADKDTTTYQDEFNKLILRIRNDSGFWIARYETSLDEQNNIAQSKKDKVVLTNKNWYDLYNIEKTLSNENVSSHMIWGCQWDQIMIWMKDVNNIYGQKNRFYILDSTNKGNYSDLEIRDSDNKVIKKGGEAIRYGSAFNEIFATKNIYDLAGNVFEWTMESYYNSLRVVRGGYCAYDGQTYPVSSRFWFQPEYSGERLVNIGSRMTIY